MEKIVKEKYEKPLIEIIELECEDIITDSDPFDDEGGEGDLFGLTGLVGAPIESPENDGSFVEPDLGAVAEPSPDIIPDEIAEEIVE